MIILRKVDFPQPFGPTRPMWSGIPFGRPSLTVNSALLKMLLPTNSWDNPDTLKTRIITSMDFFEIQYPLEQIRFGRNPVHFHGIAAKNGGTSPVKHTGSSAAIF